MSTTIKEQLQILEETKAQIKQALIDKKINVIDTDTFRSYADKIDDYTSDATATSNDLPTYKTAYVKGEKITGTLKECDKYNTPTVLATSLEFMNLNQQINYVYEYDQDCIIRAGHILRITESVSDIANFIGLTSDMIMEGNTILGIVGTGKATEDLQAQLDEQDALIARQATQIEELKSLLKDKASNISSETIQTVNEILGNEEV